MFRFFFYFDNKRDFIHGLRYSSHLTQHNKQHLRKVLHSSFHLNGHSLGFHPQTQNLAHLHNITNSTTAKYIATQHELTLLNGFTFTVPLGSISKLPAKSCKEIKANEGGQAVSGKYWFYSIIPETNVLADCNMATEGV